VDSLDELREDLWSRWRSTFDRFADLEGASPSGERRVYAKGELFDLKKYTPQEFPAGGRLLLKEPESAHSCRRYWLDAKGRPVHFSFRVNYFAWEGFYHYTAEEVEFVEFCLQTNVVSKYARMALQEGIPRSYQKIFVNGGGSHIGGATAKTAMDRIMRDSYFHSIEIEEYEVSRGRIVAGNALMAGGMGQPEHRMGLEYSYSDAGTLRRIDLVREDGSKYTSFAARSRVSMKELAAKLSQKIAARSIEALSRANRVAPLQAVELSFRSVTNYVPGLIPAAAGAKVSDMGMVLAIGQGNWIGLNEQDFEPDMAEFVEMMNTAHNWEAGTRMLRHAASLVTKLAPETIPTCDGFIAFAIDWEFEGHELLAVLKQCGATAATLKRLKEIGWLS
jgi:hypothetical protein